MLYSPECIKAQIASLEYINERLDAARGFLNDHFSELSAFLCCMPFPAWIKNQDTRMIYVNRAYENAFGVTAEQYNTKFDSDIWTKDAAAVAAAAEYKQHDLEVMSQKSPIRYVEIYVDPTGVSSDVDVIKWGLLDDKGNIIGVAGVCVNPLL